jgi:hypothetical protein
MGYYGIIIPIDVHIFQDGYCTTNQMVVWGFDDRDEKLD